MRFGQRGLGAEGQERVRRLAISGQCPKKPANRRSPPHDLLNSPRLAAAACIRPRAHSLPRTRSGSTRPEKLCLSFSLQPLACSCRSGSKHLYAVGVRGLPMAMIEGRERKIEAPRQIEVQRIVSLEVVPACKFDNPAGAERLEVHADIKAVEIFERLKEFPAFQYSAPVLAKQHVTHFDAPLHRHMQHRALGGERIDRSRVGRAFGSFLEKPGERNAGVEHKLGCHQRARRSPRASASACPAVREPRVFCSRRIFAAMRLPAARRFAATTLRAMITGSEIFIAAISLID